MNFCTWQVANGGFYARIAVAFRPIISWAQMHQQQAQNRILSDLSDDTTADRSYFIDLSSFSSFMQKKQRNREEHLSYSLLFFD